MTKLYYHKYNPPSLKDYPFGERVVTYGEEIYEPSPNELKRINETRRTMSLPHKTPAEEGVVKCIIDTDIGTDFDDTLALLYALNLENLEILGITTNYGPTSLRSFIAHKIVDSYIKKNPGQKPIPIISGANFQLGSHCELFINGNEGFPFLTKDEIDNYLESKNWEENDQMAAANFIADTINSNPCGTVKIISIGIMTNIALSFKTHPEIIPKIKEIVVMGGGSFITQSSSHMVGSYSTDKNAWKKYLKNAKEMTEKLPYDDESVLKFVSEGNLIHLFPNHNFSSDTLASVYVFNHSEIPIKVLCHSATSCFWLEGHPIQYFHDRAKEAREKGLLDEDPYEVVGLIMEEWFKSRDGQNGQCPHDPLTVHEAAFGNEQSPIYYVNGTLMVHEWAAFSTFMPNEDGKHLLGFCQNKNDVDAFLDFLGKKLTKDYEKEK